MKNTDEEDGTNKDQKVIDLTKDDGDDGDDNDDAINDYDDDVDAIDNVGVAQLKWLRHLEELDGYIPVTHDDDNDAISVAQKKWIRQKEEEDFYTPPLPHKDAVVIQKPASTGQPLFFAPSECCSARGASKYWTAHLCPK